MFYLVYIGRSCFREQGSDSGIDSKGEEIVNHDDEDDEGVCND